MLLAWVVVPFYYHSGVFTMPEFLSGGSAPATAVVLGLVAGLYLYFSFWIG